MMRADLHVHSTFSDGKNSLQEMVAAAAALGMDCLGFSDHSFTAFDDSWCMSEQGTKDYRAEVLRLREQYASKLPIFLGLERDYYSDDDRAPYDYVIGSVHYVKYGSVYLTVDESLDALLAAVDRYFSGDCYTFAELYYETVADVARQTDCDLIGHFDLVTKFIEKKPYLDITHPRYRAAWKKALDALLPLGIPFEVNTGAIYRGYRTAPYPDREIREEILDRGGKLLLTSDSHSTDSLMYRFSDFRTLENTTAAEVLEHRRAKTMRNR